MREKREGVKSSVLEGRKEGRSWKEGLGQAEGGRQAGLGSEEDQAMRRQDRIVGLRGGRKEEGESSRKTEKENHREKNSGAFTCL